MVRESAIEVLEHEKFILEDPKLREMALDIGRQIAQFKQDAVEDKPLDVDAYIRIEEAAKELFRELKTRGFDSQGLDVLGQRVLTVGDRITQHSFLDADFFESAARVLAENPNTRFVETPQIPGITAQAGPLKPKEIDPSEGEPKSKNEDADGGPKEGSGKPDMDGGTKEEFKPPLLEVLPADLGPMVKSIPAIVPLKI